MYKCLNCGNTDKFCGTVREEGNALIFQSCGEVKGSGVSVVVEEALNVLKKRKPGEVHFGKKPLVSIASNNGGQGPCNSSEVVEGSTTGSPGTTEVVSETGSNPALKDGSPASSMVKGNLWAIQNDGKNDDLTWAYITSDGCWRGFHQIKSCAVCNSRKIVNI